MVSTTTSMYHPVVTLGHYHTPPTSPRHGHLTRGNDECLHRPNRSNHHVDTPPPRQIICQHPHHHALRASIPRQDTCESYSAREAEGGPRSHVGHEVPSEEHAGQGRGEGPGDKVWHDPGDEGGQWVVMVVLEGEKEGCEHR